MVYDQYLSIVFRFLIFLTLRQAEVSSEKQSEEIKNVESPVEKQEEPCSKPSLPKHLLPPQVSLWSAALVKSWQNCHTLLLISISKYSVVPESCTVLKKKKENKLKLSRGFWHSPTGSLHPTENVKSEFQYKNANLIRDHFLNPSCQGSLFHSRGISSF